MLPKNGLKLAVAFRERISRQLSYGVKLRQTRIGAEHIRESIQKESGRKCCTSAFNFKSAHVKKTFSEKKSIRYGTSALLVRRC